MGTFRLDAEANHTHSPSGRGSRGGLAIAAHNPAPVTKPYNPDIDPADFGGPIDNPYLPLKPGTVFTYRGVGDDGTTRS